LMRFLADPVGNPITLITKNKTIPNPIARGSLFSYLINNLKGLLNPILGDVNSLALVSLEDVWVKFEDENRFLRTNCNLARSLRPVNLKGINIYSTNKSS